MKVLSAPRVICDNPNSVFSYFAWPTVGRLPDGTLAVVCSGYRMRHVCPFGKACISYSRDEGQTWTRPAPVIDTPLDDRDSGLCVTGDRVILTSFNNTRLFQRETINSTTSKTGETDSSRLIRSYIERIPDDAEERFLGATYTVSRDGGYTFGDVKVSPVTSPHGPCETFDKRVLWVGKKFGVHNEKTPLLCCEMNENDEFVPIGTVPEPADMESALFCEPHALSLPDGTLLVAIRVQRYRENPLFTVFLSRSTDGGHTFSMPVQILPDTAGSPPHLLLRSDGSILLSYASRNGSFGIRARLSTDNGLTWGEEIPVTDGAPKPDLGYPATVERSDGSLLTVYYENDGDTATIRQIVWMP